MDLIRNVHSAETNNYMSTDSSAKEETFRQPSFLDALIPCIFLINFLLGISYSGVGINNMLLQSKATHRIEPQDEV